MELGLVGLPRSGKTTLFMALTGQEILLDNPRGGELHKGAVPVPDERLDWLASQFPGRRVPVQVTYVDFQGIKGNVEDKKSYVSTLLNYARPMDAFVMVLRNFNDAVLGLPNPHSDFEELEQEFILTDLITVERRLEKIDQEKKRGRKISILELELLEKCKEILSREEPLRNYPDIAEAHELKGFTFLSGKPLLIVVNNEDEDPDVPSGDYHGVEVIPVRAKLEMELNKLDPEELKGFQKEYGVSIRACDLVISRSFSVLGLVTFYTVGDDENRAWTIKYGTTAMRAAGTIHSDMEKGFIRAEVVHFEDIKRAGGYAAARKEGLVRLEGKEYIVRDGDIMHIRFNTG